MDRLQESSWEEEKEKRTVQKKKQQKKKHELRGNLILVQEEKLKKKEAEEGWMRGNLIFIWNAEKCSLLLLHHSNLLLHVQILENNHTLWSYEFMSTSALVKNLQLNEKLS